MNNFLRTIFTVLCILFVANVTATEQPKLQSPLKEMQRLRVAGQIDKAITLGEQYINSKPARLDFDVELILGLMFLQKHNYTQAEQYINRVLELSPNYVDAKIALVRIKIAQKRFAEAKIALEQIIKQHPLSKEAYLVLIDLELSQKNDLAVMRLLRHALKIFPNDSELLARRASFLAMEHMYARSADLIKNLLIIKPQDHALQEQLHQIETLNPHLTYGLNEVGISSEGDYVRGINDGWQYTTLYYNHSLNWGLASLSMNDTTRFGSTANQAAINLFPVFNKDLYWRFTGAYANQPILFPTYVAGMEGYASFLPFEFSLGTNYSWIIANIAFAQYTGSISKEVKDYWFSFRPTYYVPLHGPTSILYTATAIKYFGHKDTYFKITAGSGYSPNLANLTTVDFIVVNNNFVTASIQLPVINHSLLLSIGGDYQHWIFPKTSKIWDISGLTVGLNYSFDSKSVFL